MAELAGTSPDGLASAQFGVNEVTTMPAFTDPGLYLWYSANAAVAGFINFLPSILGAVLVLVAGWFISAFLAAVVGKGLNYLGFDRAAEQSGFGDFVRRSGAGWTPSRIIAECVKWFVRLIFIQAAAGLLMMPQLTAIINSIVLFIPNIIVAVGIIVIGSLLARFLSTAVQGSVSEMGVGNPYVLSAFTKYAVMAFAILAAVDQLGIAKTVVATVFIGLVASVSVALGLAFGLGGRDVAAKICNNWYDSGVRAMQRGEMEFDPNARDFHGSEYGVEFPHNSVPASADDVLPQSPTIGKVFDWEKDLDRPLMSRRDEPLYRATESDAKQIVLKQRHLSRPMPDNLMSESLTPESMPPSPTQPMQEEPHRQPQRRWFWPFG
jgi:hypothetical protein